MNYLNEIREFYNWLECNPLDASVISLWHALMHTANKTGWQEWFTVSIATLESKTGLCGRSIYRARNTLKQLGRIDFKSRPGKQSATYKLLACHTGTQSVTQEGEEQPCVTHRQTKCHASGRQSVTQVADKVSTLNKPNISQTDTSNEVSPPKSPQGGLDGRFARFWEAYPKKVGKGAAEAAWKKRKPDDALLSQMLQAIERAKQSPEWTKDGGQYIPNPSTWLNQRRWEDELGSAERSGSNGGCWGNSGGYPEKPKYKPGAFGEI